MSVYSATARITSISPGDSFTAISAERLLTNQASDRVFVARPYGRAAGSLVAVLTFSADPGAFTVDVQEAAEDADANYVQVSPAGVGTITVVNAGFVAQIDLSPFIGKFVRFFQTLQTTNAVTCTGKFICA